MQPTIHHIVIIGLCKRYFTHLTNEDENQKRGLTHFGKVKKWKDHLLKRQWMRK
jgi:hypothetical protein